MRYELFGLLLTLCLSAVSCATEKGGNPSPAVAQEIPSPQDLRLPEQEKILVSKGIIRSANEIAVYSRIVGQLKEVRLQDGQVVKKGEVLFTLEDEELLASVELCEAELEQAQLNMESILIGQGYKRDSLDEVPENIKRLAKVKSGCNVREKELEIARKKLENAKIKAPIGGVITNVAPTSYAYVNPGITLCKIVDNKHLVVEFSILETELKRFAIGNEIKIIPISFVDEESTAIIKLIGSIVDEAGMITVTAELGHNDKLMPGMTAIIKI